MAEASVPESTPPLISVAELKVQLGKQVDDKKIDGQSDRKVIIFDCRFQLGKPHWGRESFVASHIPGAQFLDLDEDLSAAVIPGKTGRHPLPKPQVLAETLAQKGVNNSTRVIVYDDAPGFFAARAWWLLRWLGHEHVYVLNGGIAAWLAEGGETETGIEKERVTGDFKAKVDDSMTVSAQEVMASLNNGEFVMIDARAEARFRGEVEPIDPIAGHIPGAVCLPCNANVDDQGKFLDSRQLSSRLQSAGNDHNRVCYCGSGVTACHNILAAAVAGMPLPRLYAGSWSEWITQPDRPVATGD